MPVLVGLPRFFGLASDFTLRLGSGGVARRQFNTASCREGTPIPNNGSWMASKTKKNPLSSAVAVEKLYDDTLEPYAKQLGLLIHDWNELHLEITSLFLVICPSHYSDDDDEERDILLALWNAIPNERLQRDMLRK